MRCLPSGNLTTEPLIRNRQVVKQGSPKVIDHSDRHVKTTQPSARSEDAWNRARRTSTSAPLGEVTPSTARTYHGTCARSHSSPLYDTRSGVGVFTCNVLSSVHCMFYFTLSYRYPLLLLYPYQKRPQQMAIVLPRLHIKPLTVYPHSHGQALVYRASE